MKNSFLILATASTIIGLASCGGSGEDGSYTKQQLDSILQVREDSVRNALKFETDSLLNVQAQITADSLRRIDSITAAGNKGATSNVGKKQTNKPEKANSSQNETASEGNRPETEEAKKPGLRGKSDQAKAEGSSDRVGLRGKSDQAKDEVKNGEENQRKGLRGKSDQAKDQ